MYNFFSFYKWILQTKFQTYEHVESLKKLSNELKPQSLKNFQSKMGFKKKKA
jgi:hypothetical protein